MATFTSCPRPRRFDPPRPRRSERVVSGCQTVPVLPRRIEIDQTPRDLHRPQTRRLGGLVVAQLELGPAQFRVNIAGDHEGRTIVGAGSHDALGHLSRGVIAGSGALAVAFRARHRRDPQQDGRQLPACAEVTRPPRRGSSSARVRLTSAPDNCRRDRRAGCPGRSRSSRADASSRAAWSLPMSLRRLSDR